MINLFEFINKDLVLRRAGALLFHTVGILICYWIAFMLRFDFTLSEVSTEVFIRTLPLVGASFFISVFAFGLHRGLWRFFTLRDCFITFVALLFGAVVAVFAAWYSNERSFDYYPRSVLPLTLVLLLLWEIGWRGIVRLIGDFSGRGENSDGTKRVVLVGNADEADAIMRAVQGDRDKIGKVVGVVSPAAMHEGAKLRGRPVFGNFDDIPDVVKDLSVTTLLFLPPFTAPKKIRTVMDQLTEERLSCDYHVIPGIEEMASGKVDVNRIREVALEDLLDRPEYELDFARISGQLEGRVVMVTGAGGSIGSEICCQVVLFKPSALILFENSEHHLFQIERELSQKAKELGVNLIGVAGDVRKGDSIRRAMSQVEKVHTVFHAAAYKHVDLMERNSVACFENNVFGTKVLAEIAEEAEVENFVLISTDKAVRPTSMMGASKRLAERLLMERPPSKTSFKAVRFGNVLGSNGSVIPIFQEQIAKGGPVTVTSDEVTRFFMTIPEAVELVLSAGAFREDRRIFVLEMGTAVKIDKMARRMIELSGFVPDVDIAIEYIGLKSGEKEYEELLTNDEDVVETDQDRIWVVSQEGRAEASEFNPGDLESILLDEDLSGLRNFAHSMIPGSKLLEGAAAETAKS